MSLPLQAQERVDRTRIGNVEFEGAVREDPPGSDLRKETILDEEGNLFILSWGGFSTVARPLLSINEEHLEGEEVIFQVPEDALRGDVFCVYVRIQDESSAVDLLCPVFDPGR